MEDINTYMVLGYGGHKYGYVHGVWVRLIYIWCLGKVDIDMDIYMVLGHRGHKYGYIHGAWEWWM